MNLCLLAYIFLYCHIGLGIGNESLFWWELQGRCKLCSCKISRPEAIFCANFGHTVFGSKECRNGWCPTCYLTPTIISFSVWRRKDPVTGKDVVDEGDGDRFKWARPGDALVCPFECDECAFYRIKHSWPDPSSICDKTLLAYIRQVNLDAFWSRQPSTIRANLYEFKTQAVEGQKLGFLMFDPPGPFGWDYDSGIRAAIGVLMKSLQPGIHEEKVKHSSARKARSIHTNLFKVSAKGYALSHAVRTDKRRSVMARNPTDSEFYTMFAAGFKARVGIRIKQDEALSISILVKMQELSEEEWNEAVIRNDELGQLEVAEWTTYFLCTFCHSFRGWETVKAVISRLENQIVDDEKARESGTCSHMGLPLFGRFKNCGNMNIYLLCMIAGTTASGLRPVMWTQRLLYCLKRRGTSSDWLFQNKDGSRKEMKDFERRFYSALYSIHQTDPSLFDDEVKIEEDFHLSRSFRRGATTRAQVAGVHPDVVEWVNRWGTGTQLVASGPMRILYSERKHMLSHFLKFSSAL